MLGLSLLYLVVCPIYKKTRLAILFNYYNGIDDSIISAENYMFPF